MHKPGYSILLVQLVQAHVAAKAAANPLQIEKDSKAGISWVRMNLYGSSPRTCTCWYFPENRIAIFVSVHKNCSQHTNTGYCLSALGSQQDAVRLLLNLGTLAEARARGIVTLSGKIWGHYLQNSWSFILFFSLHCFLYQILWMLTNKCLSKKAKFP